MSPISEVAGGALKNSTTDDSDFCFRVQPGSGFQLADAEVAEGAFVGVVGEHEVAWDFFGEGWGVFEFALGDGGFEGIGGELIGEDFFVVEPVFDGGAEDEDAGLVPLAGGFEGGGGVGGEDVVEGGGEAFGAVFAIGVAGVVEHLVFGAWGVLAGFGDEVFDAVVAFGGDFPFPGEFEVGVGFFGDDVSAVEACGFDEIAIDDFPAGAGRFFAAEEAPAVEIFAVEEGLPLASGLSECGTGEKHQEGEGFHDGGGSVIRGGVSSVEVWRVTRGGTRFFRG